MKILSTGFLRRLEAEEKYKILQELQMREAARHAFLSPAPSVTRRYRSLIEKAGDTLLGIFIAIVALLANYFVFVRWLHVDF